MSVERAIFDIRESSGYVCVRCGYEFPRAATPWFVAGGAGVNDARLVTNRARQQLLGELVGRDGQVDRVLDGLGQLAPGGDA